VIWLAENWSTDLPPLGWYGSGGGDWHPDQPALKVLAYCFASDLFRRRRGPRRGAGR
jgi:hypothetical protein